MTTGKAGGLKDLEPSKRHVQKIYGPPSVVKLSAIALVDCGKSPLPPFESSVLDFAQQNKMRGGAVTGNPFI